MGTAFFGSGDVLGAVLRFRRAVKALFRLYSAAIKALLRLFSDTEAAVQCCLSVRDKSLLRLY